MKTNRAFTLVELLIAVGITAVLAAVLLSLVVRTMTLWERSASALEMENAATLVLDRLALDLESAYADTSGAAPWFEVQMNGAELVSLSLIAMTANTSGATDDPNTLRELRYDRITETQSSTLYRQEATAAATLANDYAWQTWPNPPAAEFLLSESLQSLQVAFYDGDRNELTPPNLSGLRLMRVSLVLLTDDGRARLAATNAGRSNEPLDQIIAETGRIYVRWIRVGGQHR